MSGKIIKTWVNKEKGISLFFTENEKGLFVPSSNDAIITNWLLNETKKPGQIVPVKREQIPHVLNAAKDRLAHPEKTVAKQTEQQNRSEQLWRDNPIAALQEYFQKGDNKVISSDGTPVLPKYQTIDVTQGRGEQTVTIALTLPSGDVRYASANSAQEAKRIAAMEYGRDVLGVFGEQKTNSQNKTQQTSTTQPTKTSAERGYYQLGDVFSVDGEGNAYKLPKTEYQIFLGPDLWMGRNNKKLTLYSHNRPLASFEWGKSMIYGGGSFSEEKFRDAMGKEISREEFFNIIYPEVEKQSDLADYALYRGKPGTPLEKARRYSYMRPATAEEIYDTVDGFLEYYRLDDKIKEANKKTIGTHGGNYSILQSKVMDLVDEQDSLDEQILDNQKLFSKPQRQKEEKNKSSQNNPLAFALKNALDKER